MMGFITGIEPSRKCDICKQSFVATATGTSHPYDDYSCENCSWSGTICPSCGAKRCPKCNGKIKSTHDKAPDGLMY